RRRRTCHPSDDKYRDHRGYVRHRRRSATGRGLTHKRPSDYLSADVGYLGDDDRIVPLAAAAGESLQHSKGEITMNIPETVRELLTKAPLAHLTTLNSDGSPQVTVVWVGIENEEFVLGHLAEHKKVRNIRRDPRVALSLLGDKIGPQGLREYLVIYGKA